MIGEQAILSKSKPCKKDEALAATADGKSKKKSTPRKDTRECWIYKQTRHIKRNCPDKDKKKDKPSKSANTVNNKDDNGMWAVIEPAGTDKIKSLLVVPSSLSSSSKVCILFNTGVACHLSPCQDNFHKF